MLENFTEKWSIFDPEATGQIKCKDFKPLMFSLEEPLGWDDSYVDDNHR